MTTEKDKARVSDNELIAEFMGADPVEDIPYDKDWNLLMPVVEKILKMNNPSGSWPLCICRSDEIQIRYTNS